MTVRRFFDHRHPFFCGRVRRIVGRETTPRRGNSTLVSIPQPAVDFLEKSLDPDPLSILDETGEKPEATRLLGSA